MCFHGLSYCPIFRLVFSALYLSIITCSSGTYKDSPFSHQTDHPYQAGQTHKPGELLDSLAYTSSTDESKLRLALLIDDKIDKNKDGLVQLDELAKWLRECLDKYAQEDVNRHWMTYNKPLDNVSGLTWKEYSDKEYDHLVALAKQSNDPEQVQKIKKSQDYHIQRDLRRWKTADSDRDGRLNRLEFKAFLHPEHSEHMQELVIEEKFDLIDGDSDGRVSVDEYLLDVSSEEPRYEVEKDKDLMEKERAKFYNELDRDNDKYVDKKEFSLWIGTSEMHDHSISEAQHLMQNADLDKDHRLSKEEVLAAYHEFVHSHATDFGEALRGPKQQSHDEL